MATRARRGRQRTRSLRPILFALEERTLLADGRLALAAWRGPALGPIALSRSPSPMSRPLPAQPGRRIEATLGASSVAGVRALVHTPRPRVAPPIVRPRVAPPFYGPLEQLARRRLAHPVRFDRYHPALGQLIRQDRQPPTLALRQPAEGAITNQGVRVSGVATDDRAGVAAVRARIDSGPFFAVWFDPRTGAFEFPVEGLADGLHTVTVQAVDRLNKPSQAQRTFTFDATAPAVEVTSPATGLVTTTNVTIQGRVSDAVSGVATFQVRVDGAGLVDVPVDPAGNFTFTTSFPLDGTANGPHTLRFVARDRASNETARDFTLTLNREVLPPDTVAPTVLVAPSGTLTQAPNELTILFSEAMGGTALQPSRYALAGPSGTIIPTSAVAVGDTGVRLVLPAPLANGDYTLTLDAGLADLAGNALAGPRSFAFRVQQVTQVQSISPSNGEELVSLTRETVLRFDRAIDPATLTSESFYLIALGQRVAGRIAVSPNERMAIFFYDQPLTPSTEVRVVVDGGRIMGRDGLAIDGDRDGLPGGVATADFTTLPLTFIPGTTVWGRVYDSYNRNPDGSDIPVVGARISLDADPSVFAVTDETGYFELGLQDRDGDGIPDGLPAPEFFVHIDGGAAINAPEGTAYATLGKPFHSVPGQRVQLEMDGAPDVNPDLPGDQFHIFLPPMAMSDVVPLDPASDTVVGFGPAGLAQLRALFPDLDPAVFARLQVTYPAGSAQDERGNVATRATVIPVAFDRLPAPLPPGASPRLVISIQAGNDAGFNLAGGPSNFLTPAPITFPNLEGLAPGEKSLIFSFDHDAGRWVVIGSGTISPDGLTIVTDPGVGILAPGWHYTNPGADGSSDEPNKDPSWDEINKVLNDDYKSKFGTKDAALAHQILCIAQVACDNAGDGGWGSGWVKDVFEDMARDIAENRYTTPLPEFLPNWLQAVWGGFGYHFFDHLLPSFIKNCDRLDSDSDGDGKIDHEEFFDDAVVKCFDEVYEAGELGSLSKWLAQKSVPLGATMLRWTAKAVCAARDGIRTIDDLLGLARDMFEGGVKALEFGGKVYRDINSFIDDVRRMTDPLRHGVPMPQLDPGSWRLTENLGDFGDLIVDTTSDFFLDVGSSFRLNISGGSFFGTSLRGESSFGEAAAGDVEYVVMASPDVATVSTDGVLTIHSTTMPYRGTQLPLYIFVKSGDRYGIGQFAIRDADTDGDGLVDSYERKAGLDPRTFNPPTSDLDGDGIPDIFEAGLRSSPRDADSDRDGVRDGLELLADGDLLSPSTPFSNTKPHYFLLTNNANGFVIRGKTNARGRIDSVVLAPDTAYTLTLADTASMRIGSTDFVSPASGQRFTIPTIKLAPSIAPDDDADGLPSDIETVVGTDFLNHDSDGDGITDGAELIQGLNPLDNRGFPTGVIANLALPGSAEAVDVAGDFVYVATGSHGLAIVNGSRFNNPILFGQIDLPGNATGVAVAPELSRAVVAAGSSLELVDISDPMTPRSAGSIAVGASHVQVVGGFAYAVSGSSLVVVDLASNEIVQRVTLPGSGGVTGLARFGTSLYAYVSGSDVLAVVDVARPELTRVVGQLTVSIASSDVGVFAGDGVVWLAGSGLRTVDVSDPTRPTLRHGADSFFNARKVALNGSGLGLLLPDGGRFVQVYDTRNPDDTDALLTQFNLTGPARSLAISRGIAYIGTGNRLEVVNYRPFDTMRLPPSVTIGTTVADLDPEAPGVQVMEGTPLPLTLSVSDDVQVRIVEYLINGVVVASDVSFPFDVVPSVPAAALGETVTVQVRATDTGGNVGLSNVLTFSVVPDTFAPAITSVIPAAGATVFEGPRTVRIRFSERIDAAGVTGATFRLVGAGADDTFGTDDDVLVPAAVSLRDGDRLVQVQADALAVGRYQLQIDQAAVTDVAGNPLGVGAFSSEFVVRERPTIENLFDLRGTPVTGDLVLTSPEFRVGINPDGSFITSNRAVGIFFADVDFVERGTPLAGFTISRDGQNFTNENPAGGSAIAVTRENLSDGPLHGVRVVGIVGGNLRLERVVLFNDGDESILIAIRLTNIGDTTLTRVASLENIDPDQGSFIGIGASTYNDVRREGRYVDASVFNASFPAGLTMGLGSEDPRAVVSAEQFFVRNPFDVINSPQDPDNGFGDNAINLAFDFGDLAPGESVSGAFIMSFGRSREAAEANYVLASPITAGGSGSRRLLTTLAAIDAAIEEITEWGPPAGN